MKHNLSTSIWLCVLVNILTNYLCSLLLIVYYVLIISVSAQIASIATNSLSQMGSDDEDILCKRKTKRGILPKTATKIMKSWLFQHIVVSIGLTRLHAYVGLG